MTTPTPSPLNVAFEAFLTALGALGTAVTEELALEFPDLGSILDESLELAGNISNCVELVEALT